MDNNNQDLSQERIILDAASKVFMRKGYDGARMQEIADEAGINKALLHYYFRSKDQLFGVIFRQAFGNFWPSVESVFNDEKIEIRKVIKVLMHGYIDILEKMPYLPNFIIGEINRNAANVAGLIQDSGIKPQKLIDAINQAMDQGELVRMDPRELIIYMLGTCIFPVVTRPLLGQLLYNSKDDYQCFMANRKETAYLFICRSVCIDKPSQ